MRGNPDALYRSDFKRKNTFFTLFDSFRDDIGGNSYIILGGEAVKTQ
jgi:hypothetical protein